MLTTNAARAHQWWHCWTRVLVHELEMSPSYHRRYIMDSARLITAFSSLRARVSMLGTPLAGHREWLPQRYEGLHWMMKMKLMTMIEAFWTPLRHEDTRSTGRVANAEGMTEKGQKGRRRNGHTPLSDAGTSPTVVKHFFVCCVYFAPVLYHISRAVAHSRQHFAAALSLRS